MRPSLAIVALALGLAPSLCGVSACSPDPLAGEPSTVELVYAVDPAVVRGRGWVAADATDDDARTEVRLRVAARVRALLPDFPTSVTYDEEQHLRVDVRGLLSPREQRILEGEVRSLGRLELLIVAEDTDLPPDGLAAERERVEVWRAEHPDAPLATYNRLPRDEGGPAATLWAYPAADSERSDPPTFHLLRPRSLGECFGAGHLAEASLSQDRSGSPAVGFRLTEDRLADFRDFTEHFRGRRIAIVFDGRVHSAPRINDPLPGAGIISGGFAPEEARELARALSSDSAGGPLTLLERITPAR